MKKPVLIVGALLIGAAFTAPVLLAQDAAPWQPPMADDDPSGDEDGFDMIGRSIGSLMENFMRDVAPDLNRLQDDMSGALGQMAPVLKDLAVLVDDLRNYTAPERLENGDIIIRRRADAPPPPPLGNSLRDFGAPEDEDPAPEVTPNPYAPEIEL